jgi:hypothetical protein
MVRGETPEEKKKLHRETPYTIRTDSRKEKEKHNRKPSRMGGR